MVIITRTMYHKNGDSTLQLVICKAALHCSFQAVMWQLIISLTKALFLYILSSRDHLFAWLQVIHQLKQLGTVWQDVLPVGIYCKAMGNLLNTAITEVIAKIMMLEVCLFIYFFITASSYKCRTCLILMQRCYCCKMDIKGKKTGCHENISVLKYLLSSPGSTVNNESGTKIVRSSWVKTHYDIFNQCASGRHRQISAGY